MGFAIWAMSGIPAAACIQPRMIAQTEKSEPIHIDRYAHVSRNPGSLHAASIRRPSGPKGGTRTRIIEASAPNDVARAAIREMTASWMDPEEVGARVVAGIRANAPYILTHVEFRAEVRELYEMLDAAFPRDQQVPPGRGGFEERRRALVAERRAAPIKD